MAISTQLLRSRLENAWRLSAGATAATSLRDFLLGKESSEQSSTGPGSIESVTGNGHSVQFAGYGPGQMTALESVEAWRGLIDGFDESRKFLLQCAQFGLEPFLAEGNPFPDGQFEAEDPFVLDSLGKFDELRTQFSIDIVVVGAEVNDAAVFCWMMYHMVPIREVRSDYHYLRTAVGSSL